MTSETNGDRFRLAWFRRKVAELGKLLELLPSDRRALALREREERDASLARTIAVEERRMTKRDP